MYPDGGFAWTRDGKSLLYVEWGVHRLWRVEITGDRAAQPVEIAGFGAIRPADRGLTRPPRVREGADEDTDIYRFEVGRPAEPVITSTFRDGNPQFSPDGRRVAFESERSGEARDLARRGRWLEPEAAHPRAGALQGSPRWSPDGRRIAFDSEGEDGRSAASGRSMPTAALRVG